MKNLLNDILDYLIYLELETLEELESIFQETLLKTKLYTEILKLQQKFIQSIIKDH